MTLKLFIFCTTYVLLVYGNNTEREGNNSICRTLDLQHHAVRHLSR